MSILGKKLLSLQNRSDRQSETVREQVTFAAARNIGILYTWESGNKESVISEFTSQIGQDRQIKFLCFNPDRKQVIETEHPVFSEADLTLLGKINSEEALHFLQEPFDYLFHLDFELNELMKSLLLRSKAKCRVGFHTESGENCYELMIGINKSAGLHNFTAQILKYVNALS